MKTLVLFVCCFIACLSVKSQTLVGSWTGEFSYTYSDQTRSEALDRGIFFPCLNAGTGGGVHLFRAVTFA